MSEKDIWLGFGIGTCAKTLSVSTVVSALCWTCWKSNKGIWARLSLLATHPVDQIQGMLISMYAFQGQLNNYKIILSLIVQVNIVLNVVDSDWRCDDLCGSHLQSQSELYHISWWYYTLVIDLLVHYIVVLLVNCQLGSDVTG